MRKIRLTFTRTGESVLAEMLEADAPRTCEHIWNMLPVERDAVHGMYSGAEVFALIEEGKQLSLENQCQLPLPGELLYFFEEGANAASGKRAIAEVCLVYGRGVTLRSAEGVPTYANLFARIPGDWKYDWVEFSRACRRARWEGPQPLRIERA